MKVQKQTACQASCLCLLTFKYYLLCQYSAFCNAGIITTLTGNHRTRSQALFLFSSPRKWAMGWFSSQVYCERSLVGCSPWGRKESDTTERLHFHFSLSCIGDGNGNPLQCSCLENPRDSGAWWAAVYGVAQSWKRLKRLSSSSSSRAIFEIFL